MEGFNLNIYEKSLQVMNELFGRDYQFALATSYNNIPSVRFVDTFYYDNCFYIVSYANTKKVQELEINPRVSLCYKLYRFDGIAHNLGHPLKPDNSEIRKKLIEVFKPWYFEHNDESNENMCYVKIELTNGFFYKDGVGYKVDFRAGKAEKFPFDTDIKLID